MKKLFLYYFIILIPLPIMVWLVESNMTKEFVILLLFYALIYRPLTDGCKLFLTEVVKKNEFWKMFIPFYLSTKYFKELYLK